MIEAFGRRVAELEGLFGDADLRDEAIEAIRTMIMRIRVAVRAGVFAELAGARCTLARCPENAQTPPLERRGFVCFRVLDLVAGAGFEPTTFRL
jgi:hypothetical protein